MPDAQGDLEVVIAHRNNVASLRRCLDALAAQSMRPSVCVIDDASSDETPEIIPGAYPDVRYLRLEVNAGFSAANNRGIRSSEADWVLLLNNDAIPEPDFVELAVAAQRRSGAAMVAPCLRRMDGRVDSMGVELDRSLVSSDLNHGLEYEEARLRPVRPLAPCAGAGLYRRDAILDVGGFDEAMFAYLEDVELGIRLTMAGHTCEPEPAAVAWHDHSAYWGSGSARKNRRMGDSRGHLCWKYRRDLTVAERARGWVIDGIVYAGQLAIDRNAGAVRGRVEGWCRRRGLPRPGAHDAFSRVPRAKISVREALRRRLARRR